MSALNPLWESSSSSSQRRRLHRSCTAPRGRCGSKGRGEAEIFVPLGCCAGLGDQKLFSLLMQGAVLLPSKCQKAQLPQGEPCCCRSGDKGRDRGPWSIPPSPRKPLTPAPICEGMAPASASYCPKATAIHQHHPTPGALTDIPSRAPCGALALVLLRAVGVCAEKLNLIFF